MRTWLRRVLWGLLLGLILAQVIPVSRTDPENNPARSLYANAAVPADVRSLLERSCAGLPLERDDLALVQPRCTGFMAGFP
ncbi:MAG TPA: hypothetical protein VF469_19345 [Kofleriaceae bacterium]